MAISIRIFLSLFFLSSTSFSQVTDLTQEETSKSFSEGIQRYSPSFYPLDMVRDNIVKKDYQTVKKILEDVEKDYLEKRVAKIIKKTAEDFDKKLQYRNVNSNHVFDSSKDYFDYVSKAVKNSQHLLESIHLINKANEKYLQIKGALLAQGVSEAEISQIEFKLNKLKGILNMYRDEVAHFKLAISAFLRLLSSQGDEKRLSHNKKERLEIYGYLAGCYHELAERSRGDDVIYRDNLRNELYYLWLLLETKDEAKESKDYKFQKLVRDYYAVIDFKGVRYANHYKPYLEQIGKSYKDLEERAASSEDQPEIKDKPAQPAP